MQGYRPEHLEPAPDCVVVGNAISRGNAEVEETLNRRLVYRSQAEVVKEEFIRGRRSLVVAGTHGKTTTTSIATWVMERGGLNPSFLVGGVVQNFGASFRVTDSDYFIIEGDEYDTAYFDKGPKFMHYLPEIAVVGNIEFDHADIYKDLDAVKLAFRRLMNLVPGRGASSPAGTAPPCARSSPRFGGRLHTQLETFGTCEDARWRARDIDYSGALTRFRVLREGEPWGEFETPLIGDFNVRNCLSVIIAADAWGIPQREDSGGARHLPERQAPHAGARRGARRHRHRRLRAPPDGRARDAARARARSTAGAASSPSSSRARPPRASPSSRRTTPRPSTAPTTSSSPPSSRARRAAPTARSSTRTN